MSQSSRNSSQTNMTPTMKRLIYTAVLLIVSCLTLEAKATFELEQPRNAVVGQPYYVTYVLRSDSQNDINTASNPSPERPQIDGFKFYSGPGVSTGMESGYDSSRGSYAFYTIQLTYTYIPQKEGTATIPSLSMSAGGKTYKSKSVQIKVLPSNRPAQGQNSPSGQGYTRRAAPEQVLGSSVGTTTPKDLMVIITFSRKSVYEMEPVVADIKLCLKQDRRFDIGDQFNSVTLPEFDGFISEDLPVPRRSEVENIDGQNYETLVIRRYLLYPQKAGKLRISSGQYEIDVIEYEIVTRSFSRSRREVPRKMSTATNTVTLDVKPLPEPRPAGFSGAVGQFSVTADINPEIVRSNESSTYSLTVKGSGNIKYLNAPQITFPSTFETYTPKTDIEANFNGSNYAGTFRADYPFVPTEVGKFNIEPFEFIFFNPSTAKYETVSTRGFDLNVLRGNGPATVGAQKEINTEMTDILHIHPLAEYNASAPEQVFGKWWYWTIYVIVFLTLITVVFIYRRHVKRSADVAGRRLARASRVATKRLRVAAGFMKQRKSAEFYDELARALKGYVGDKLGIATSGLISDVISEKLTARGVPEDIVTEVINVLNDCEMARFTPSGSDEAMAEVYARATAAVKAIENVK